MMRYFLHLFGIITANDVVENNDILAGKVCYSLMESGLSNYHFNYCVNALTNQF